MIAGLAAALFLAWLAMEVVSGNVAGFDAAVRGAVHSFSSPPLTYFMQSVTGMGQPWFLIMVALLVGAILMRRGRVRAALPFVTATVAAELANTALKLIFHRPRPDPFFGLPHPATYSFPSGHAMVTTCFFGGLAILACGNKRRPVYWAAAILVSGVIGLSRVYLGVHYPSDVLGGYAGAIVVLVLVYGNRRGRTCAPEQLPDLPPGTESVEQDL